MWAAWQRDRQAREEWTLDIVDWQRVGDRVELIRSGPHLSGDRPGPRAQALSQYYFLLEEFDPVAGHPKAQSHLATGVEGDDAHIERAERNRDMHSYAFRWSALKRNLRINRLYGLRALAHLDVHYTFLSAFVHPTSAGYEMVWGRDTSRELPRYDHYAAELLLLYCFLAFR
jgi:hypothetical protein